MPAYPFISTDSDGAAEATGLSRRTIDYAVASGDLIPRYVGAKRVFLADELDDWVRSQPDVKPAKN